MVGFSFSSTIWGSLESLNSLESLEHGLFWKDPFPKDPIFRTRLIRKPISNFELRVADVVAVAGQHHITWRDLGSWSNRAIWKTECSTLRDVLEVFIWTFGAFVIGFSCLEMYLVDVSGPKKIFTPPHPPQNSPDIIPAPRPPPFPPSLKPPLLGFSIKKETDPPPLPPPRAEKKLKISETSTKCMLWDVCFTCLSRKFNCDGLLQLETSKPQNNYHSFRNHYIVTRKPLSHVTVIAENSWKSLRWIICCNCILQEKQGNCNCKLQC